MDRQVETDEIGELRALVTHHLSEVVRPILVGVDRADTRAILVDVAVHECRDRRQLGDEVH